ncbi:exopolysaccharide biosynthesis polyprenyl glycosylphosphotransferase [Patescibacteria group bacterium]|nr:exopolysaccharide biosynthesis polyprenyl glycosylphosphotransferase [Patescibacteria group bacterium]MBP9709730.1 exopolysaccharide biosynthesis polyprenyl glycosylphosphotransferase [Patescibacteria group bacterium]
MIQAQQQLKRLILISGDFLLLEACIVLTLFIRYGSLNTWPTHIAPFTIVTLLWIIGFYIAGLYDLALGQDTLKLFRTYLEGMIVNLGVAFGFFYLLPVFGIAPRANLLLYFLIALLFGYAWRLCFHRFIMGTFERERVLFIGPVSEALEVHELLRTSSLGADLVAAVVTQDTPEIRMPFTCTSVDHISHDSIQAQQIQTVVLGTHLDEFPQVTNVLYTALFDQLTIIDRAELEEATTGRIPLSYVNQSWFLQHLNESEKAWYESFKRGTDIFLAIPFAFLTLFLTPLVTLLIKLSSAGPIFYSQTRVGRHGKLMKIWKFRTMNVNAEKDGPRFTASTKTDPRVFALGRLLRQLRIDELPQIWNVLRGDLTFVGPRPERPEFVDPLIARMPYYNLRHLARPGLTGWAQVRFLEPTSSLEDNLKKLQYDLFYIKHRSLLLDAAILLKTIGIILRRQGT